MPTSLYQITVSNFNGTTPCQSYSVYTGTTHDIDDADYVEDVNVPVSGYTLTLDIDSSYTGVYLFIEHCDGHINSVPSSTPKLQGGYQLVFVDLRCDNCIGERPAGTPTPTITPTYSQTITPTYSQTVTPTYSQTVTPTYSQTITPTINASATPTPTYSQTVTPTYSQTVTPTYSQTVTPTLTPMVEEECYCYTFTIDEREFGDYGGPIVEYLDCSLTPQSVGFSGVGTFSGYCISSITNWYRFVGPELTDIAEIEFSTYTNTMNPCTVDGDCIVTGEPTPTPTPTYSQTVTPTRTPTLTPTYSQTITPTYSQTVTPTQTITITETPINEPTPTLTPTQTPINETPCNCYTVECTSGDGCPITYENCLGELIMVSIAGSYTTSICGNIVDLEQPNLIITNTGNACFFDGEIYTCLECNCTTIQITEQDIAASDTNRVYVEVIPCSGGTSTTLQYSVPGTYRKCLQSVISIYILVGGNQTAPGTSTAIMGTVACSTDNDCEQT